MSEEAGKHCRETSGQRTFLGYDSFPDLKFKFRFSGIASYLPRSKIDDKEKPDDDSNSPYSVNYSGEFNKNQGYSYIIQNKNGNHSGYVSFPDLSQSKLNTQPKG